MLKIFDMFACLGDLCMVTFRLVINCQELEREVVRRRVMHAWWLSAQLQF